MNSYHRVQVGITDRTDYQHRDSRPSLTLRDVNACMIKFWMSPPFARLPDGKWVTLNAFFCSHIEYSYSSLPTLLYSETCSS